MKNGTKQLNKQNNRMEEQVAPENEETYTNMVCYLRGAGISDYQTELVRQDILEMLLSAQERGEDIHALFGGDEKRFCDEVIENLPPKTGKQRLVETLDILCCGLSILIFIYLVISKDTAAMLSALISHSAVNWNLSVSTGSVVSIFLLLSCAIVLVNRIMKHAFRVEKKSEALLTAACIAAVLLCAILTAWIGSRTWFTVPIFAAAAVSAVLFAAHKALERLDV